MLNCDTALVHPSFTVKECRKERQHEILLVNKMRYPGNENEPI
jgi:hypothetical protein